MKRQDLLLLSLLLATLSSGASPARAEDAAGIPVVAGEPVAEDTGPAETEPGPGDEDETVGNNDGGGPDADTGDDSTDGGASASSVAPAARAVKEGIDQFYVPLERLTEHFVGTASRPIRFDWRGSLFSLGVTGSELIERNNFGSFRFGAVARKAFLDVMVEGAVTYVSVLTTQSSDLLSLTPYTQASRPWRFEIDVNASYPLAEAVVTPVIDFLPPAEIVLSATAGGRYLVYPDAVVGDHDWKSYQTWIDTATWRDVGLALATPQLSEDDILILERRRLGGMNIDTARVHSLAGLTLDVYYQPGIFISARSLLAIPILAPATGTQLGFWWEMSVALGYAF